MQQWHAIGGGVDGLAALAGASGVTWRHHRYAAQCTV
jgi:hypothetical protein